VTDVVIGDDHAVFSDALASVLRQRRLVVRAMVHRAADVLDSVRTWTPDLCMIDRWFADGDGIDLVPAILESSPATNVIMVTADPKRAAAQ